MINPISKEELLQYTGLRTGETKLGETLHVVEQSSYASITKEIENSPAPFVLVGIPEDIGVRGNLGRKGAIDAWWSFIQAFVNIQENNFLSGYQILVLGTLQVADLQVKADQLNQANENDLVQIRELVEEVDQRVSTLIELIVKAGKTAIVIGGGHNNSYPIIKGASEALDKPLHVINCDPHGDFRALEGRHSGNGFAYAMNQKFMHKYAMVGLHESYNNQFMLDEWANRTDEVFPQFFEDVFVRSEHTWKEQINQALDYLGKEAPFGIELDLDSIAHFPVSAATPSGIRLEEARQYVHLSTINRKPTYIHLCEGAPTLGANGNTTVGKGIAYLVSDFLKAY